jgi:hypothetical protein
MAEGVSTYKVSLKIDEAGQAPGCAEGFEAAVLVVVGH